MRCLIALSLLLTIGCSSKSDNCYLTEEDRSTIRSMIDQYTTGWVMDDTTGVIQLFAEDAVIYPSGMEPYRGANAIRGFWWPDDGSKTTVHAYTIQIEEIGGCGNMAYTVENGRLSFSYVNNDTNITKESRSYAITSYEKQDGTWRIVRRIWTDIR